MMLDGGNYLQNQHKLVISNCHLYLLIDTSVNKINFLAIEKIRIIQDQN